MTRSWGTILLVGILTVALGLRVRAMSAETLHESELQVVRKHVTQLERKIEQLRSEMRIPRVASDASATDLKRAIETVRRPVPEEHDPRLRAATHFIRDLLTRYPADRDAATYLGMLVSIHIQRRNPPLAQAAIEEFATTIAIQDWESHRLRARAARAGGQFDAWRKHSLAVIASERAPMRERLNRRFSIAFWHRQNGRFGDARRWFCAIVDDHPSPPSQLEPTVKEAHRLLGELRSLMAAKKEEENQR